MIGWASGCPEAGEWDATLGGRLNQGRDSITFFSGDVVRTRHDPFLKIFGIVVRVDGLAPDGVTFLDPPGHFLVRPGEYMMESFFNVWNRYRDHWGMALDLNKDQSNNPWQRAANEDGVWLKYRPTAEHREILRTGRTVKLPLVLGQQNGERVQVVCDSDWKIEVDGTSYGMCSIATVTKSWKLTEVMDWQKDFAAEVVTDLWGPEKAKGLTDFISTNVPTDPPDRLTSKRWFEIGEKLGLRPRTYKEKNMSVILALHELAGDVGIDVDTSLFDTKSGTYVVVSSVESKKTRSGESVTLTIGGAKHVLSTDENKAAFAQRFKAVQQVPVETAAAVGDLARTFRTDAGLMQQTLRNEIREGDEKVAQFVRDLSQGLEQDAQYYVNQAIEQARAQGRFALTLMPREVEKKPSVFERLFGRDA